MLAFFRKGMLSLGVIPLLFFCMASSVSAGGFPPPQRCHADTDSNYDDFWDAFVCGKPSLNVRLRYEHADQDGLRQSNAGTIRTRLSYHTGVYKGLSGLASFSNTTVPGNQAFNSGGGRSPNRPGYAVIADPRVNVFDRAYVNYALPSDYNTELRGGRQVIALDEQRFIGHVGFRQNWQTFDAAVFDSHYIKDIRVYYAYVGGVNRVWGPRSVNSLLGHNNVSTHLVNLSYHGFEYGNLIAYAYLQNNHDIAAFSNNSYGIRFDGKVSFESKLLDLLYTLEYAYQTDTHNNAVPYSANYFHVMTGVNYDKWLTAMFDWEQLGGSANAPGKFFRMPMATLHKFQGWADLFLVTPAAGINDYYATLKFHWPVDEGLTVKAIYHYFTAQDGGASYGHEIDVGLAYQLNQYLSFQAEYGHFFTKKATVFPDTQKIWLYTTIKF